MHWALAMGLAAVVGLSLGMFGSGGSILAVPFMVYLLGIETKTAIAMSLAVVGFTSAIGAWAQWRQGTLCLKAALFFSAVGVPGTYVGTWAGLRISDGLQMFLFGLLMLGVAIAILLKKEGELAADGDECHMRPDLAGGLGAGVGFMTGLLGVGGGFLIVPALNSLGHLKLRLAIGTSLLVIAANSSAGVLGYLGKVHFNWPLTAIFAAGASLAGVLGARLAKRVPIGRLRKGFAAFILAMGAWVLVKNLSGL